MAAKTMNSLVRHFPVWRILLALVLLAPAPIFAQATPDSTQGPASDTPAPNTSHYEFKVSVPLVIEDVVVLDSKEQPVHGLKASDFSVTENGKPVELRNFEEHVSLSAPAALSRPPLLGPNTFTNIPQVPQSTSLNILLLDALNTPTAAQALVRLQMLEFLKGLTPGTRVAIFGLGMRLHLLQGFTDDPAVLRTAIETKNRGPRASPLLTERVSQDPSNPGNDAFLDYLWRYTPYGQGANAALQNVLADEATAALRQRTTLTMQGMNELAHYLSALPGHKNLIWFSGSFPLYVLPNDELSDPNSQLNDFRDGVRQTADLMARGRVAIYPVDARELTSDSTFNSAEYAVNHFEEDHNRAAADLVSKHLESDPVHAEHDTMNMMAAATGGMAFYNTSGLKDAADKIMRYGENYYTIAYEPTNKKFDGIYRKIVIKSGLPDIHISYRMGYYADDPDAVPSKKKGLPLSPEETAMLHGAPDAIQVRFAAAFLPGEAPGDKLTPGGHPDASRMKPPYMSYTVQYAIDIRSLLFTVDGKKVHHASLELASFVYDREGNPINSTLSKVNMDLPDERFGQVAQQGALTRQTIEAPARGEYYLRVGIFDLSNDHAGALEVPLASLKSLQVLRSEAAKQNTEPAK